MGFFRAGAFMVLKNIVLTLILCLFCSELWANSALLEMQLALDKNQWEKVVDLFDENEDSLKTDPKIYLEAKEKLALSLERQKKYRQSYELFSELYNQVIETHEKKNFYGYKMAFLAITEYRMIHEYTPEEVIAQNKLNRESALRNLETLKVDPEEIKLLTEMVTEYEEEKLRAQYKKQLRISLEFMSFQDHVYLLNRSSGKKTRLLATHSGLCAGGGREFENDVRLFQLAGCFYRGTSTISSEATSVTYDQSSVPVNGVFFTPGYFTKTFSKNFIIGVETPVFYRSGEWTLPAGQFSFSKENLMGAGVNVVMKIRPQKFEDKWELTTKLGKLFPNPSINWSIGLGYKL